MTGNKYSAKVINMYVTMFLVTFVGLFVLSIMLYFDAFNSDVLAHNKNWVMISCAVLSWIISIDVLDSARDSEYHTKTYVYTKDGKFHKREVDGEFVKLSCSLTDKIFRLLMTGGFLIFMFFHVI